MRYKIYTGLGQIGQERTLLLVIGVSEYLPSTATFLYYTKYEEYTWYSFEIGAWNIAEA